MVICLERGADLHMAQLMPLPLTVSCSSKVQIGFTFLVPAYPDCPGKEADKWLLYVSIFYRFRDIASYLSKVADFSKTKGKVGPPGVGIPLRFRKTSSFFHF